MISLIAITGNKGDAITTLSPDTATAVCQLSVHCIYEEPLKNVLAAKRKKFFQNGKFLEQGCYSKPELYKMILPVFINNLLQINTKSQQHV